MQTVNGRRSFRSVVRAWACYTSIGCVALNVTVVGLTLGELAALMGLRGPLALRSIFLGRCVGAILGTVAGGWLCDTFPIKHIMGSFIVMTAVAVASVPLLAPMGMTTLIAVFCVVGFVNSALVSCIVIAACRCFPGKDAGPVLSGVAASFGIASAMLPVLVYPMSGNVTAQYAAVSICCIPALILVLKSETPPKAESSNTTNAAAWGKASLACAGQFLIQGAMASLLVWLTSFGKLQLDAGKSSTMLVSLLQFACTAGSLIAASFQRNFVLWNLACAQEALLVVGVTCWLFLCNWPLSTWISVCLYGLIGGSTTSYCGALLNECTTPSGLQMALISLGSNSGANIVPYVTGLLMEHFGTESLVQVVLFANCIFLSGLVVTRGCSQQSASARCPDMASEALLHSDPGQKQADT